MWRQIRLDLEFERQKQETKSSKIIKISSVYNESVRGEKKTLSVAVLSVVRTEVNFICSASGSQRYFRNVPYLSFSLCLSRQFCHRKLEGKCWKKYTDAFFSKTDKKQQFVLKRRHKAKCSGTASKEYKVQQNPS